MWFRDVLTPITQALDCEDKVALKVLPALVAAYERGNEGKPFSAEINGADEYHDGDAIKAAFAVGPFTGEVADTDDLAELIYDAWKEGITLKDRVAIKLVDCGDAVCECGACVPAYDTDEPCSECGSLVRDYQCYAEVHDDFAHMWADSDQTIDGSSWECASDMPGFAYTILTARPGLADELRAEGYDVDESEYTAPES